MRKLKLSGQISNRNDSCTDARLERSETRKKSSTASVCTLSPSHSAYQNKYILLKYLGTESTVNYFYGDGINIMFIIENISSYSINVTATQISVNGHVILEEQELLSEELLPEERSIEKLRLYYKRDRLAEHQIFDPINIKDISFNLIARRSDEQSVIFQEKISVRI